MEKNKALFLLVATVLLIIVLAGLLINSSKLKKEQGQEAVRTPLSNVLNKEQAQPDKKRLLTDEEQVAVTIWKYVDAMNNKDYDKAFRCLEPQYASVKGITPGNLGELESGWFPMEMGLYVDAVLTTDDNVRAKISLQPLGDEAEGLTDLAQYVRELVLVKDQGEYRIKLDGSTAIKSNQM